LFERFTALAGWWSLPRRKRLLNHNYIGTEHILLGLIHEARVAAKALESLNISPRRSAARSKRS
jgi:ATP-dependent Clp protease ATP-binding subunit ClpC